MRPDLRFEFIANRDNATLTIRREFAAHRTLVWNCYTTRELLEQWFAPKPMTTKTKSFDFRPGGHWIYAMVEPSGQEYWGRTDYQAISPTQSYQALDAFCDEEGAIDPELPRARWDVSFEDLGGRCLVQTVVTYASVEDLEKTIAMGMEEGLGSTLEKLDELLEKHAKLRVEATIAAPVETVWACWTSPEHITQWNFASDDWCCPRAENDLRVGGRYVARMEARDGSFGFDFEATYDEVVSLEKLVYTMPNGRSVATTFIREGDETKVATVFDPDGEHSADMQRSGWQAILDNFKEHAESQA